MFIPSVKIIIMNFNNYVISTLRTLNFQSQKAFGSKVKEMAKEKVKEKIEPVITKRRNQKSEGQASSSSPNLSVSPEERDGQSNSAGRLGSERSLGSDSP